jgi:hypothetical protein
MINPRQRFSRRKLLASTIAVGAGAVAGSQVSAATVNADDPLAADYLHTLYRRIRFGANGAAVYWWLRGTRYGLVDNVLTPFFDMHVGSIHRRRDLDAERYEISTAAAIYYAPVGASTLLERWDNPVTGRSVRFEYTAPRIATATYSLRNGALSEPEAPGMRAERTHFLGPARRDAGRIWLDEATHVRVDRGARPPMKVHDLYTYSVAAADLVRPEARQPGGYTPALAAFNDFNDWSPRFEMGDHPGSSISRCTGSKVGAQAAMPAVWRSLHEALYPRSFAPLQATRE